MLNQQKNIFDTPAPFLVLYGNQDWKVATEIISHARGLAFVEPFTDKDAETLNIIAGHPWYIGGDVWEFDFGTKVMTLDHPNYHHHPGWRLWLSWLSHQKNSHSLANH